MNRVNCIYRIYPSWFGGDDMAHGPIVELAHGSARRMGRMVSDIAVTGHGNDRRGGYIDFSVTYSSSNLIPWEYRQ